MRKVLPAFLLLISLAFSSSYEIDEYNVLIEIQKNGDINFNEEILVDFKGEFKYGYRDIPINDIKKIGNIYNESVKINGKNVAFYLLESEQGDKRIEWFFPTKDSKDQINIFFKAKNIIEKYNDSSLFCWTLLGDSWGTSTEKLNAKIIFPKEISHENTEVLMFSQKKGTVEINENEIIVNVEHIKEEQFVGTCIIFENGIIQIPKENTFGYSVYDSERIKEEQIPLWKFLLVPFLGFVSILLVWVTFGKDYFVYYEPNIIPPTNISPAVLPNLMNANINFKTESFAGTIIDLIARGYIGITEIEKDKSKAKIKKDKTILTLKKMDSKLKKHEKIVIGMLFWNKKKIVLDDLMEAAKKDKNNLYSKKLGVLYAHFKQAVVKETKKKDFYDKTGIAVSALIAMIYFFMSLIGTFIDNMIMVTGLVVFPFAIFATVFMAKRKKKWIVPYSKWKAFEKAVSGTLIYDSPPSSVLVWKRILAYATVLGKAERVMEYMDELKVLPSLEIKKIRKINDGILAFNYFAATSYMRSVRSQAHRGASAWRSSGGGFSMGSTGGGGFR